MPSQVLALSCACSVCIEVSDFSAEKHLARSSSNFSPAPRIARSLSLADYRNPSPGLLEPAKDGWRAQEPHVVHHHFFAGVRVDQIVAAHPMHNRRPPSYDAQIVRIGETWNHGMRQPIRASPTHLFQRRHQTVRNRLVQILRFAPIKSDHYGAGFGDSLDAAVRNHSALKGHGKVALITTVRRS